ncbi:MAG: hypothetical protein E7301_00805 [Butyrivibrio sp.]|nr:hypothetical protein [Butyrivibrio sp.]
MGKFYIDVEKTGKSVTALRNQKENLVGQRRELNKVYNNLWLSNETDTIKQILEKLDQNIKLEADEVEFMANALEAIINLYTQTENNILLYIQNGQNLTAPNNQGGGNSEENGNTPDNPEEKKDEEENKEDDPFNVYEWLSEQTGIPQEVLEALAFILSFIPVVNCLTDIIDLVNDFSEFYNDKELDAGEMVVLALDLISFVSDINTALNIIEGAKKATKVAKSANIEAKKASGEAKKAAQKAAERSGKKGKSTVRAVNRANTAAKKANEAKKAAKNANKIAFNDIKEQLKKETRKNVKNYLEPDPEDPLSVPGMTKDIIKEQVKQRNYYKNRNVS